MPKVFGKEVKPVWLAVAGAAAIYLGYRAAFPPIPTATTPLRKRSTQATAKKTDIFIDSDYTVRFASISEPIKDSFKPLIVRDGAGSGPSVAGGIPAAFASGDGNWVYSGMATVNGVAQALLENRSTGDAAFVGRGQRWKSATIGEITADTITLTGPGGLTQTLAAGGPSEPSPDANVSASQPVQPIPVPGMNGPIGGNMANSQPGAPAEANNNGGRRRGRGGMNFGSN